MDDDAVDLLAGIQQFCDPGGPLLVHVANLLRWTPRGDGNGIGIVFVVGFAHCLNALAVPELERPVTVFLKAHAHHAERENLEVPEGEDLVIDQLPIGQGQIKAVARGDQPQGRHAVGTCHELALGRCRRDITCPIAFNALARGLSLLRFVIAHCRRALRLDPWFFTRQLYSRSR